MIKSINITDNANNVTSSVPSSSPSIDIINSLPINNIDTYDTYRLFIPLKVQIKGDKEGKSYYTR